MVTSHLDTPVVDQVFALLLWLTGSTFSSAKYSFSHDPEVISQAIEISNHTEQTADTWETVPQNSFDQRFSTSRLQGSHVRYLHYIALYYDSQQQQIYTVMS